MNRTSLSILLLVIVVATLFAFPASSQDPMLDPTEVAGRGDDKVVIAGKVLSATDADEDGKNDTFVIETGEGNEKTVKNMTETKEMGVIEVDDHVEIEVKVLASGELIIQDVIKIGQ